MQSDTGCKVEEANILGLSETLLKQLDDLQARLDNRFNRTPQPTKAESVKDTYPNVLTEIISNLELSRNRLDELTSFISNEVLPKIN